MIIIRERQHCIITSYIYKIKQDIRIYKYVAPIAGQTAGPNGLNFFVDTHGWQGGVIG